jgi:hypothetical protein
VKIELYDIFVTCYTLGVHELYEYIRYVLYKQLLTLLLGRGLSRGLPSTLTHAHMHTHMQNVHTLGTCITHTHTHTHTQTQYTYTRPTHAAASLAALHAGSQSPTGNALNLELSPLINSKNKVSRLRSVNSHSQCYVSYIGLARIYKTDIPHPTHSDYTQIHTHTLTRTNIRTRTHIHTMLHTPPHNQVDVETVAGSIQAGKIPDMRGQGRAPGSK